MSIRKNRVGTRELVRLVFGILFAFGVYHTARDLLQVFDLHSGFTNLGHRPHQWCAPWCDYVTLPLDVFTVLASFIVLKRGRVGKLGLILLASLPLWLLSAALP